MTRQLAFSLLASLIFLSGCATTTAQGIAISSQDGFPLWISNPRYELPEGTIAGIGESTIADVDVEAAKSEAEASAASRIALELEQTITTNLEKNRRGKKQNQKSKMAEKWKQKIVQRAAKRMVGVRNKEYFYVNKDGKPDRVSPKKIFVRAILTIDNKELAEDLGAIEEEAGDDLWDDDEG